jgi:hypothetical protein
VLFTVSRMMSALRSAFGLNSKLIRSGAKLTEKPW